MAIVSCPDCNKKLKVADTSVGKKVKCSCGNVFVAQVEAPVEAAPMSPEKVFVACTECGAKLKVATTSLGKKMKCPKCAGIFVAHAEEAAPPPPPPPSEPEFADDDDMPPPMAKPVKKAAADDDDLFAAAEDELPMATPKAKGKGKGKKFDDDDDDAPPPKAKPGKKPVNKEDSDDRPAAGKPVYPSRILQTLLVTFMLLFLAAIFAVMFFGKMFDVDPAQMAGIPSAKGFIKARKGGGDKAVDPADKGADAKADKGAVDKGVDKAGDDKEKNGEKDKNEDKKDADKAKDDKDNTKVGFDPKSSAAQIQIGALTTASQAFFVKHQKWPQSLQQLLEPDDFGTMYLKDKNAILDPWKKTYQYNPDGPKNEGLQPDIWTVTPTNAVIGNWTGGPGKKIDKGNGKDAEKDKEPKDGGAAILEGRWIIQSATINGKEDAKMKGEAMVFAKGTVTFGPDPAPYKINESANPKTIDLSLKTGPDMITEVPGIYKIEGETLYFTIPMPGPKPVRPENFEGKSGILAVLRRAAKGENAYSRIGSTNNLKSIALAAHSYHDVKKSFPPAALSDDTGKPLLSWRVAILPYIEQDALYRQFDLTKSWDDPHNMKLVQQMPKLYMIPGVDAKPGMTHYRALVGPGTALEPLKGPKGNLIGRSLVDMPDGSSNVILAVEAKEPTIWTRPDDLTYDPKGPLPKFGVIPEGFNVVLCDGLVRFVNAKVPENVLRPYLTCQNGIPRQPLEDEK